MGAKLGAKRLVAAAEKFGFNEKPEIPAAKVSTIPKAKDLQGQRSPSAPAAIGQNKDLATPLEMASVAATIANQGVRIKPWLAGSRNPRKRVVSARSPARCAT